MTTPDLVEVVARTLARHKFQNVMNAWPACSPNMQADFRDQARAVLDALAAVGNVEWGVQYGYPPEVSFDDGLTMSMARSKQTIYGGRILTRLVFPWTAARPDNPSKAWRIEHEPEAYFTEARTLAKTEAERQIREGTNHDHA